MSANVAYLLTCFRAVKDQGTQLFTYVDAFDFIVIPKDNDFVYQTFAVAGKIRPSISCHMKLEISFEYPDGTKSPVQIVEGEVIPLDLHFSVVFPVIKFSQEGPHYLRIKFNDGELETQNRFYFWVKKQE